MDYNRELFHVVLCGLVLFLLMPALAGAETNVIPNQNLPDLVVKEVTCSSGNKLYFSVANIGAALPSGWMAVANVYFDGVNMGVVDLARPTSGDLTSSGGAASYLVAFDITRTLEVKLVVDSTNSIAESNEGNNIFVTKVSPCEAVATPAKTTPAPTTPAQTTPAQTTTQLNFPDMVVKEIKCSQGKLSFTAANIGGPMPAGWWSNAAVKFDGVHIGLVKLENPSSGDLNPSGGVATYLTEFEITRTVKVEISVDGSASVTELNEGNNYMYSPVEPCGEVKPTVATQVTPTPTATGDIVAECIAKNQKLKGLSYEDAKKLCTVPVETTKTGIEGCIEKYMDVFKISYEEAKKRCESETSAAKTVTAVTIDRCGDLEKKLNILIDKLNVAKGTDVDILKKEIETLKIELKSCEAKTSTVQKDATPGIKNPCDEVKMLKESIEQLTKKISYIKELIAKGELMESDLKPYTNEYYQLTSRLEKMNFACQQGKPVEESPCARLSKLEMIYKEINDKLQSIQDEKSKLELNEKLASVVKEINTLKQKCRGENLETEKVESLYDIEKAYRAKQKVIVEGTSEKDMQTELAKIESEKRKLIEEYAQRLQELDARHSTIIKKLEIKNGKIVLDDITSKSNKVKVDVENKSIEIEPTDTGAAIIHGDIKADGNIPLEYAAGALISSKSGKEIKILPSQIKEKVKGKVKDIKINDEGTPKYIATTESKGKILGFIPTTITKTYEISAEDGKIISEKKSWWSFVMTETPEQPEVYLPPLEPLRQGPREQGIRVNLSNFWQNAPPDQDIGMDPISGMLHLYWLDSDGNICRGNPGVTGQPGSAVFYPSPAIIAEVRSIEHSRDNTITLADLMRLQEDTFLINGYGAGSHILQYTAYIWRARANGEVFEDFTAPRGSLPVDASLSEDYISPSFVRPVYVFGDRHLGYFETGLPIPDTDTGLEPTEGQHPTKCRVRQNITASDLIRASSEGRLEGSLFDGYLRIR